MTQKSNAEEELTARGRELFSQSHCALNVTPEEVRSTKHEEEEEEEEEDDDEEEEQEETRSLSHCRRSRPSPSLQARCKNA